MQVFKTRDRHEQVMIPIEGFVLLRGLIIKKLIKKK